MKPLTRKQTREALETVPIDQILGVPAKLTHKQKEFARLVALGETGAGAYREAYKSKGKPSTVGVQAHRLKNHPQISRTIEAFQVANEAQKYQTPAQLRALVLHSLVQTLIDPEAKHATKVAAAKVLGTVTEVAAFTERKEIRTIKSSEDAKSAVLAKLREVLKAGATDADILDGDSLLRELTGPETVERFTTYCGAANPEDGADVDATAGDGATPTPRDAVRSPTQTMHSNPHEQSHSLSDLPPTPHDDISSLERELSGETPPLVNSEKNG